MSKTLHKITLEILNAQYDLKTLPVVEIHKAYRVIYAELQQAEDSYVKENPGMKLMV
ncbi:hypothetical protein [Tissierella sp.]|uniref:hypothetical protein n=1 Tax=Tissierella sp. TaxID=41274 RepID=UPI003025FD91